MDKINITPSSLKNKLGILGEPVFIGVIIGTFLGILGNLDHLDSIKSWGEILSFAVSLGAILVIFPMIAHLFGEAFAPITKAVQSSQKNQILKKKSVAKTKGF